MMMADSGREGERPIDWSEAHARLARMERIVATVTVADADEIERVLRDRARALARRPTQPRSGDQLEVVSFSLGRERYAVEALFVEEVFRLTGRSALPGATAPIAGVTAHRGELLTLLDLRAALGLSAAALDDLARVIVLRDERSRVGVLVDAIAGVQTLMREDLRTASSATALQNEYLAGVTDDLLMLLDPHALLRLFDKGDTP